MVILYENNIHLKIEKDIYQVFVLIKDLKKIHVPNYILLFCSPLTGLCITITFQDLVEIKNPPNIYLIISPFCTSVRACAI